MQALPCHGTKDVQAESVQTPNSKPRTISFVVIEKS